jgi:hypothetical protein
MGRSYLVADARKLVGAHRGQPRLVHSCRNCRYSLTGPYPPVSAAVILGSPRGDGAKRPMSLATRRPGSAGRFRPGRTFRSHTAQSTAAGSSQKILPARSADPAGQAVVMAARPAWTGRWSCPLQPAQPPPNRSRPGRPGWSSRRPGAPAHHLGRQARPAFRFSGGFAGPGWSITGCLTRPYDALAILGVQDQPHVSRAVVSTVLARSATMPAVGNGAPTSFPE